MRGLEIPRYAELDQASCEMVHAAGWQVDKDGGTALEWDAGRLPAAWGPEPPANVLDDSTKTICRCLGVGDPTAWWMYDQYLAEQSSIGPGQLGFRVQYTTVLYAGQSTGLAVFLSHHHGRNQEILQARGPLRMRSLDERRETDLPAANVGSPSTPAKPLAKRLA